MDKIFYKLETDEKSFGYARIYASLLKDEFQRKRAYASVIALNSLVKLLEKTDNQVKKAMTLYRNPQLNEEYEICDVYINDWHIDVRVMTEGNEFLVPKIHFDKGLEPDFYAVIKTDKNLKEFALAGFCDTAVINMQPLDYRYSKVSVNELISLDEFLAKITNPKLTDFAESEHDLFRNNYLSMIDGDVDENLKTRIIKHLFECEQCRTEFCCFTGFEMVSSSMGKYPELLEDHTLRIVGAQAADDEIYEGKEEIVYFDKAENITTADESKIETDIEQEDNKNTQDETVSDILDELFTDEEENSDETVYDKQPDTDLTQITADDDLQLVDDGEVLNIIEETNDDNLEIINEKMDINDLKMMDNPQIENTETQKINMIQGIDDKSDIKFIDDLDSEDTGKKDDSLQNIAPEENKDSVQKVIVDYDETGEPIYSYITNVPPEDEKKADFETDFSEMSDEDILNSKFETYPEYENTSEDLSNINNGGARTIDYVQYVDVVNSDNKSEHQTESSDLNIIEDETENNVKEQIQDTVSETENSVDNNEINDINSETESNDSEELSEFEEYPEDDTSYDNADKSNAEEIASIGDDSGSNEQQDEEYIDSDEQTDEDDSAQYSDENEEYSDGDEEYYDENEEYSDEYEEYSDEYEEGDETNTGKSSNIKMILLPVIILAVIICIGATSFIMLKNRNNDNQIAANTNNNAVQEQNYTAPDMQQQDISIDIPSDQNNQMQPPEINIDINDANAGNNVNPEQNNNPELPPLTENTLIQQQNQPTEDVNKAITNAFATTSSGVSIKEVSWLCSPQLFTDSIFKSYLQSVDDVLKLNLRKNILSAMETPQSDKVVVKLAIDNNGNIIRDMVSESSGSQQIDDIVLQSIKETFEGQKTQIFTDGALMADKYYLKVVIKI